MNIKETFLRLTDRTYPHGTEDELNILLPEILDTDEFGNRFIKIGESTCMFTCHLDTATSAKTEVNHIIEDNIIKSDGTSILGADDKAGVTILLYMIKNKVPGLYYFFLGEEVGCVGSRKVSTKVKSIVEEKESEGKSEWEKTIKKIKKVIAFDRRGYDSVITHQSSSRCCSDNFAQALSEELNKNGPVNFSYKIDPTGIYTDSAQFTRIYPECTNISVGYKSEHTFTEQQDILHLEELAKACLKIDWENLPVQRDPSKYEYDSSYRYYGGYGYWESEWEDYYSSMPSRVNTGLQQGHYTPVQQLEETSYFMDDEFRYVSGVKRKKYSNILVSVDFADERIEHEKESIIELLDSLDVDYENVSWNGMELKVHHNLPAGHTTVCSRYELSDFIPSLDFWKKEIDDTYNQKKKLDKIF